MIPNTNYDISSMIENEQVLSGIELDLLVSFESNERVIFPSLDAAIKLFNVYFSTSDFYIHKGGHHVALVKNGVRVMLVTDYSEVRGARR